MRPTLPRIPRRAVNMLSVEWITKLIACIKYAMDYPKGDGKTTYRHGETISALRQSANVLGGESGDTYKGYFKVIKTADDKVKVVYGYDEAAANCGYATINDIVFNVVASAELTITANAFIYLQSIATLVGSDWVAQTPTIEQSAAYPTYEANKFKRLLANVYFADSKITGDPVQQQFGAINGETVGECT